MSAPRDADKGVHPLARPLAGLIGPRAGLFIIAALGSLIVLGFVLETVLKEGGLSKYPDVYGAYELLPLLAGVVALAGAWALTVVLRRPADFYSRAAGDLKEGEDV